MSSLALPFLFAPLFAGMGDALPSPIVVDLVGGAEICAAGKLSDVKMAERLGDLGWAQTAKAPGPGVKGTIALYRRNDVRLTYFTSKELTECWASADTDASTDIEPLLAALSDKFGKQPKVETPGVRYLYYLPRLKILTVQIKPKAQGRVVELAVVH
jgi:hypothetical protein